MRRVDESPRSMPEISVGKVCFIIAKSRELIGDDSGLTDDASDPADDGMGRIRAGAAYSTNRRELSEFIEDFDDDETAALVALVWIGRGDFEAGDWRVAVAQARERREQSTTQYLLGTPLLSDYLEEALSAFGQSCADFDSGSGEEG